MFKIIFCVFVFRLFCAQRDALGLLQQRNGDHIVVETGNQSLVLEIRVHEIRDKPDQKRHHPEEKRQQFHKSLENVRQQKTQNPPRH